jgi:hypothetical protein
MNYIYNDEDNAPMNDEALYDGASHEDPVLKYTTYSSIAEMKADERGEALPFTDPPEDGCWNCLNFDWKHEACTMNWNNLDESYYNPDCDDRKLTDYCEDHETDPDAVWEDIFDD